MNKLYLPPASLAIIVANALPVYGAYLGKLNFFQVLYLFWFETVLLVFFDCLRIATACGNRVEGFAKLRFNDLPGPSELPAHYSVGYRIRLMAGHTFMKLGMLLFYLLFIILFIGFQLSGKKAAVDNMKTVVFQNDFFNGAVGAFVVSMLIQYLAGFILNGRYRRDAPLAYTGCFDARTMLIHVMLVGSVFIHKFLFEGKSYEHTGEIVYVGLFMGIKTIIDLFQLKKDVPEPDLQEVFI